MLWEIIQRQGGITKAHGHPFKTHKNVAIWYNISITKAFDEQKHTEHHQIIPFEKIQKVQKDIVKEYLNQ